MLDLSIIIVNHNAKDILTQCLNSIYDSTKDANSEIIVIDNASGDGSPQIIRQRFPRVKLIQNNANLGLTRAQNQGLKKAEGRYFLLLNNDTIIQSRGLDSLIEFMNKNPTASIAGPSIFDIKGRPQLSFGWIPKNPHLFLAYILFKKVFLKYELKKYNFNNILEVDYVSGACLIIRKSVMDKIGLMDEGYFVYNEDDDLCLRARRAGWKIYYVPEAAAIHYRGKGGGQLHPYRMVFEIHKGIFRLYRKFYAQANFIIDGLMLVILILRFGAAISLNFLKTIFQK